jgi:hypothetical protein
MSRLCGGELRTFVKDISGATDELVPEAFWATGIFVLTVLYFW